MKRPVTLVLALASLIGCSQTSDQGSAPAASTTASAPAAAPAPAPAAAPAPTAAAAKLECEKLVPKELQTKYGLNDPTFRAPGGAVPMANCDFMKGASPVGIGYVCPSWDEGTFRATMENGRKSMKSAQDVPGLGRMGYMGTTAGITLLQFWDDDTSCYVTLTAPDEKTGPALAKEIAQALTPAALGQ